MSIFGSKANLTLNGVSYSGRNISVTNGRVVIDGRDVTAAADSQSKLVIEVKGDLEHLEVGSCASVTIAGAVGSVSTASGDVHCGDVGGRVSAVSGDIYCCNVTGDVESVSGDIDCGNVAGAVKAQMGDISITGRA